MKKTFDYIRDHAIEAYGPYFTVWDVDDYGVRRNKLYSTSPDTEIEPADAVRQLVDALKKEGPGTYEILLRKRAKDAHANGTTFRFDFQTAAAAQPLNGYAAPAYEQIPLTGLDGKPFLTPALMTQLGYVPVSEVKSVQDQVRAELERFKLDQERAEIAAQRRELAEKEKKVSDTAQMWGQVLAFGLEKAAPRLAGLMGIPMPNAAAAAEPAAALSGHEPAAAVAQPAVEPEHAPAQNELAALNDALIELYNQKQIDAESIRNLRETVLRRFAGPQPIAANG